MRSSSGIGISIVYVEFDWGTDVFRNRQFVSERLQLVKDRLPVGMTPVMGPMSSIMGEIQFVGVTSPEGSQTPMELRTLADWLIRPRLMTIPGISQVIVMGGQVKQYQILVSSDKLQRKAISLEDLKHARCRENTTGVHRPDGKISHPPHGRVDSIEQTRNPHRHASGRPVLVWMWPKSG